MNNPSCFSIDEVLRRCRKNENLAQKQLYEHFLPYTLAILRRYGVTQSEEADVVQEVFVAVFSTLSRYDSQRGDFKWWLRRIVIHRALKALRTQQRHPATIDLTLAAVEQLHSSLDHHCQDGASILAHIESLPSAYRTVFNLYVIDGYSHEEIGALLSIAPASVRSRFSRARQMLRNTLSRTLTILYYETV